MQTDTIRLSVTTESSLHIVRFQTGHDVTVRVTFIAIHGNAAGLEVDAPGAGIEASCTELNPPEQAKTACHILFVTLRVGECVAFAETSAPETTSTKSK